MKKYKKNVRLQYLSLLSHAKDISQIKREPLIPHLIRVLVKAGYTSKATQKSVVAHKGNRHLTIPFDTPHHPRVTIKRIYS